MHIKMAIGWLIIAILAGLMNYACTAVNFSFSRMRKKYIEDNNELDTVLVKKVAPFYQKTSFLLGSTQFMGLFCTAIYTLAIYQLISEIETLIIMIYPMRSEALITTISVLSFIIALFFYWVLTILIPGAIALVRPIFLLAAFTWFAKFIIKCWKPLTTIGLYATKKVMAAKKLPFRDEVNFTYTEDEIRCIVEESNRGGRLNSLENTLIKNSFDFFDLDVRDVMIPRNKMVVLDFDDTMETMRSVISHTHHTCYPVCMDDKDEILGFIHVKDFLESLLRNEYNIKRIMREILIVPEIMPAAALLKLMKNRRIYLAVVVDEYGGTSGLVTLDDLLEELVGEIPQTEDPAPAEIMKIDDNHYEFDGTVIIEDVFESLDMDLVGEERNNTIGGFVFSHLERIPKVGDQFIFDGWIFKVLRMEGFRVVRIGAERMESDEIKKEKHEIDVEK